MVDNFNSTVASRSKMNVKVLLLLSLAHLVTDINQSALPALLPFFKESLDLSYTMAGILLFFGNVASSVIQPVFGYITDRRPQQWLLPLAPLLACLGMSMTGYVSSFALLLGSVILSGLGIASLHPEGYRTAYYFTGDRKATGMSIFSVGGNLGVAVGPIFSLVLVQKYGLRGTAGIFVPGIVVAALLLSYLRVLSTPFAYRERSKPRIVEVAAFQKPLLSLTALVLYVVLRSWIQFGLVSYIPFYYINYMKGNALYAGTLTSTFLLTGALGTLICSPLADLWGHKRYIALSMASTAALLMLFYFTSGLTAFLVLGLAGMTLISTSPTTVVMAQALLPKHLGMVSGLMVGFSVGTGGLGVTLLGMIADRWGVPVALNSIGLLPVIGFFLSLLVEAPSEKRSNKKEFFSGTIKG